MTVRKWRHAAAGRGSFAADPGADHIPGVGPGYPSTAQPAFEKVGMKR